MAWVGRYIASICCAAMVCCIVSGILGEGTSGKIAKLLCKVFLVVTMLQPLSILRFPDLSDYEPIWIQEAGAVAQEGEDMASDAVSAIILQQTEAYILDKAKGLGMDVQLVITLGDTDPPVPSAVIMRGQWTESARKEMESILTNDLGITKECQTWNGVMLPEN